MNKNAQRRIAVLFAALLAAPAFGDDTAGGGSAEKKGTVEDSCGALPPTIKLEGGRYVLQREEYYWKVTKGSRPPRDFVYTAADKRVYRFTYWHNKEFRCNDTGRTSN
jgi:hypothetical protein